MSTRSQSVTRNVVQLQPRPKRRANDIMRESLGDAVESIAFFCECDDERCYQAVWLTAAEYDHARRDPGWKALVDEHRTGEVSRRPSA